MLKFALPTNQNREDVLSFYQDMKKNGDICIGCKNSENYDCWLAEMENRCRGENLPEGYVRENFYLCYNGDRLVGVFSLKFELTEYLLHFGGHIGYAVRPSERNQGIAGQMLKQGLVLAGQLGFERILCVCDEDNGASEKVILKNGGVLENRMYDASEKVTVKRYWIEL